MVYYLIFGCASAFFSAHLVIGHLFGQMTDQSAVQSICLGVLGTGLYVTRQDKACLISSIPLRIAMFAASVLGLIVIGPSLIGR